MTTTVKKGAGRPAAAEKTNRHAQRTALPPQAGSSGAQAIDAASCEGGEEAHFAHLETNGECPWDHASDKVVAEARAIVPDPAPEKPMGERTVAELRKVASKLLVPGARAMKRGELLTAILEAEKAQASPRAQKTAAQVFEVAEKSAPATPPRIGRKSAKAAPEVVCEKPQAPKAPAEVVGASKSQAKADAFVEAAAALGWAEKVRSAPDQNPYGVIVGRGNERIAISWRDGVFVGEECYHSHPARSPRKVINASAAKKIMAIPAAVADEEARKVTAHKGSPVRPGDRERRGGHPRGLRTERLVDQRDLRLDPGCLRQGQHRRDLDPAGQVRAEHPLHIDDRLHLGPGLLDRERPVRTLGTLVMTAAVFWLLYNIAILLGII
jgi:hypothetical protein